MKQFFLNSLLIVIFIIMLAFPEIVLEGSCTGLLLWFRTILPTLLPFLIISGLIINTSCIHLLTKISSPVFCRLFHLSEYGSFAALSGFLCGYPMGAKVTSDLLSTNKISYTEAKYLLSFCNNTSPAFIISYVIHQNLNASHLVIPTIAILFISPIIISFLFRCFYDLSTAELNTNIFKSNDRKSPVDLMDRCIMKSFETITKIGGYIMLFSILTSIFSKIFTSSNFLKIIFLSFLEITNGISLISQSEMSFSMKYIFTLALVSFGGWCSVAQTRCMISETEIPLFPYIIEKLITTMVTSLLAFLFMKFY